MEESLPSTMVMDLSLSWMSVKLDMLREKLQEGYVYNSLCIVILTVYVSVHEKLVLDNASSMHTIECFLQYVLNCMCVSC